MWPKSLAITILALSFLFVQNPDTVALILSPNTPAVIISRSQAEQEFKQLCIDGADDQRLKALAAALNPMPDWPQFVMNRDASVCNRKPRRIAPVSLREQQ